MSKKTLKELCAKYYKNGWPDRDTTHSYIEVYEEILSPYRSIAKNILEVGLMSGESLRMWTEYFEGEVYGVDCSIKPIDGMADLTQAIKDGLNILIGDAADPFFIEDCFKETNFDVVIEDANHDIDQQRAIYLLLKPYMIRGGIYIIEDIQSIQNANQLSTELGGQVIDRRSIKWRYDDILLIIRS